MHRIVYLIALHQVCHVNPKSDLFLYFVNFLTLFKQKDEIFQVQPDILDFESEFMSPTVQNDPLHSVLFSFPNDDIEVQTERRNLRTIETSLPVRHYMYHSTTDTPYRRKPSKEIWNHLTLRTA